MTVELSLGGNFFEVAPGAYVIGRDEHCQFVVDDTSVSRRHAVLTVGHDNAFIEDLGSRNGVVVEGRQITGRYEIRQRSRFRIGVQEFEIRVLKGATPVPGQRITPARQFGTGATDSGRPRFLVETSIASLQESSDPQSEDLVTMSEKASRALAAGDARQAERLLVKPLGRVVSFLRAGRRVDGKTAKNAGVQALRLAEATANPLWIEYVFELYNLLGLLLPREAVDSLHRLSSQLEGVDLRCVEAYLDKVRESEADLDSRERAELRRIVEFRNLLAQKSPPKSR